MRLRRVTKAKLAETANRDDEAIREQLCVLRKHVTELATWVLSEWTKAVDKTIANPDRGEEIGQRFGDSLYRKFFKLARFNSPILDSYIVSLEVELLDLTWGIKPDWLNEREAADPDFDYHATGRGDD